MRLSDCPTVDVDIVIDAPPDRVWPVATDLTRMGEWSPENKGGQWVDGQGPEPGATFRGRNQHPAVGEWETMSTITEFEPPRRMAWAVMDPSNPSSTWWFELEPEGDGTRLRQHVTIGPGPNGLTSAVQRMPDKETRIVERRLEEHRANMTATLEGIKATVEGR